MILVCFYPSLLFLDDYTGDLVFWCRNFFDMGETEQRCVRHWRHTKDTTEAHSETEIGRRKGFAAGT